MHVCRASILLEEEEKYALIFNHTTRKEYEYMACMPIADLEFVRTSILFLIRFYLYLPTYDTYDRRLKDSCHHIHSLGYVCRN